MQHLTEDQLVLYHYGEAPERPAIERHLAECASCAASYQALRQVLAAVDAAPVPERSDFYGAAVWARIRDRLEPQPRAGWLWGLRRWAMAGAMAALVVAAFLAGRYSPRPSGPNGVAGTAASAGKVRERILLVAVGDHLDRSQMVLVELANASSGGSLDISSEQQWAEDLLDTNRLYRQTATSNGETAVASVLDDLERILLEIAHSPSTVSSQQLEEIRRRIESEGILFKIRVVGSKVRERELAAVRQ